LSKSQAIFAYLSNLGPDPYPVVKIYKDLTSRNVNVTKQDVQHLLVILREARLVSKDRPRGGCIVFLPKLFFDISGEYAKRVPGVDNPGDFIAESLRRRGTEWCSDDLLRFSETYGDLISAFFGVIDAVFVRIDIPFRTALFLYVLASQVVKEPYASALPGSNQALINRLKLATEALKVLYKRVKGKIAELTPRYTNRVYVNARNIATAVFFDTLSRAGIMRILHLPHHSEEEPDPQLALLFALDEKFVRTYDRWEELLRPKQKGGKRKRLARRANSGSSS